VWEWVAVRQQEHRKRQHRNVPRHLKKKRYLKPLLAIFGVFVLLTLSAGTKNSFVAGALNIGWLAASAGWVYYAFQYNSKTWPPLKATWDNSFLCNRCNEIFSLGSK
jgi:hypothetical protein